MRECCGNPQKVIVTVWPLQASVSVEHLTQVSRIIIYVATVVPPGRTHDIRGYTFIPQPRFDSQPLPKRETKLIAISSQEKS